MGFCSDDCPIFDVKRAHTHTHARTHTHTRIHTRTLIVSDLPEPVSPTMSEPLLCAMACDIQKKDLSMSGVMAMLGWAP